MGITAVATGVILYQHYTHTQAIVSSLGNFGAGASATMPGNSIAASPGVTGVQSPASGVASPLGLQGSVFTYNPPQTWQ